MTQYRVTGAAADVAMRYGEGIRSSTHEPLPPLPPMMIIIMASFFTDLEPNPLLDTLQALWSNSPYISFVRQLHFIINSTPQMTKLRLEFMACLWWSSGLDLRSLVPYPTSSHTNTTSLCAPGFTGLYFGRSALTLLSA